MRLIVLNLICVMLSGLYYFGSAVEVPDEIDGKDIGQPIIMNHPVIKGDQEIVQISAGVYIKGIYKIVIEGEEKISNPLTLVLKFKNSITGEIIPNAADVSIYWEDTAYEPIKQQLVSGDIIFVDEELAGSAIKIVSSCNGYEKNAISTRLITGGQVFIPIDISLTPLHEAIIEEINSAETQPTTLKIFCYEEQSLDFIESFDMKYSLQYKGIPDQLLPRSESSNGQSYIDLRLPPPAGISSVAFTAESKGFQKSSGKIEVNDNLVVMPIPLRKTWRKRHSFVIKTFSIGVGTACALMAYHYHNKVRDHHDNYRSVSRAQPLLLYESRWEKVDNMRSTRRYWILGSAAAFGLLSCHLYW